MSVTKKWFALLLALTLCLSAGAVAEEKQDVTTALSAIKANYLSDDAQAEGKLGISPDEALEIAVETLLRLEYETVDSLSQYRPQFAYTSSDGGQWLVRLTPTGDPEGKDEYIVEILLSTGEIKSVTVGPNRFISEFPQEEYVRVAGEKDLNERPVAADVETLAEKWMEQLAYFSAEKPPVPAEGTPFLAPEAGDLAQKDALALALEAVTQEGTATIKELADAYAPLSMFVKDGDGRRVWVVMLLPHDLLSDNAYITVRVDAQEKSVLGIDVKSAAELAQNQDEAKVLYDQLIASWKAKDPYNWELFEEDGFNSRPKEGELQQEEALQLALDTVLDFTGWPLEAMYAYPPGFSFYGLTGDVSLDNVSVGQRAWVVYLSRNDRFALPSMIRVTIDAPTGKVTDIVFGRSQFVDPPIQPSVSQEPTDDVAALMVPWVEVIDEAWNFAGKELVRIYDMDQKTALRVATDALLRMGDVDAETLAGYEANYGFMLEGTDRRLWEITYRSTQDDTASMYTVKICSPSGVVYSLHTDLARETE